MKRMVLVEPGRIGDCVLSLGCLHEFMKARDVSPIWIAREELRGLLVAQFGEDAWGGGIPSRFRWADVPGFLFRIGSLRTRGIDSVCIVSPGRSARLAMAMLPKRKRFGYIDSSDTDRCFGADGIWRSYDVTRDHLVMRAACALCPAVKEAGHRLPSSLARMAEPAQSVAEILTRHGIRQEKFVLFSTGARWAYRCWKREGWGELARRLLAGGDDVVLCGTPGEQDKMKAVQRDVGMRNCVVLSSLSIPEFVELGRMAKCMVTLDSGPMHIAAAVNTPCVALYGPSDPALTAGVAGNSTVLRIVRWEGCPYWPCIDPSNSNDGDGCRQGEHVCMENLSVNNIQNIIEEIIKNEI